MRPPDRVQPPDFAAARPAARSLLLCAALLAAGLCLLLPASAQHTAALVFLSAGAAGLLRAAWESLLPVRTLDVGDIAAAAAQSTASDTVPTNSTELLLRLNDATKAAGVFVWSWDVAGNRLELDPGRVRAYSPAAQQASSDPTKFSEEMVHPEDLPHFRAGIRNALKNAETFFLDFRSRFNDGSVKPVRMHARVFRNEAGRATRMVGVTIDMSSHIETAARLGAQAEEQRHLFDRFTLATEAAGISVWDWELDNGRLHSSDNQMNGQGRTQLLAQDEVARLIDSIVVPEERDALGAAIRTAIIDRTCNRMSYRFRYNKGDRVGHMQLHARLMRRDDGYAYRLIGVNWDITEQMEHAEQLQRQAQQERSVLDRFNLATQTADIGVWDMNLATREIHADSTLMSIYECDYLDEALFERIMHPDDAAQALGYARARLEDPNQQGNISLAHRIVTSTGAIKHVQTHIRVFRNSAGIAERTLGVTWDVTEEKNHVEQLNEQAAQVNRLAQRLSIATQAAGISPWEYDLRARKFVWVDNRPRAFGLDDVSVEEYGGAMFRLIHPDDRHLVESAPAEAITSGKEVFSYQFRIVRPDETVRHMQVFSHVVRDENGTPLRLCGAISDVTNEVQTTQMLQKQAEQERNLLDRISVATRSAGIASWELDLRSQELVWEDNFWPELLTLARPGEKLLDTVLRLMHPEDMYAFQFAVETALKNKSDLISYRYRLVAEDGSCSHCQSYARLVNDEHGVPIRALGVTWDITEEVQAAEKLAYQAQLLHTAELRLERASLSSSEGHWEWDLTGNGAWYSSSCHTLLGYNVGELPATLDGSLQKICREEDKQWQRERFDRHIRNGEPYDFEAQLITAYGDLRWFRVRGTAERDGSGRPVSMSGAIQDIHQQKLAEDALEIVQQRFERAINGTQDGLWELESSGQTAWCSPRLIELLGYAPDELPASTNFLRAFLHPEDIERVADATRAHFQSAAPYDVEIRLQTKSDGYRWYRARAASERDSLGKPKRLSGSLQDITDAKASRDALVRATEAAEAANRAKSSFLANVSHEIRTPMNGIIGMTGLLIDTPLDRTQRDYAETIRTSADSLLTVINDILDFSKIEAGKLDIELLDIDLRRNVEDVGAMMALQAASKGIELIVHVHPEVTERVLGDAQRVRQCLINLIGNAIKFTQQGEITVEVCNVGRRDGKLLTHFEVRDTGIGISEDALKTLFQPFVQADASTTRHFGGTGLGLSIVLRLVEMMGGEVGAASEPGKGSTFWFTLPFESADAQPEADGADPARIGRRLLIVDDNEAYREVLGAQLAHAGYEVTLAGDGIEALQLMSQAANAQLAYEVVLIDCQMPDMDGATLGQRINADSMLSTARLVMLTSLDRPADMQRLAKLGCAGYLTKPVRARELIECIDRVLTREAQEWHLQSQPIVTLRTLAEGDTSGTYSGRVLLVEDNAVNQKVAVRFLERLGCTVRVADNGVEGVKAFQDERYDLVLMDLQMPVMDGLAATQRIRELESGKRATPIVALTANAMAGQLERCLEAGMDAFLTKPLQFQRLRETLDRFGLGVKTGDTFAEGASTESRATPIDLAKLNEVTDNDPEFAYELAMTFIASGGAVMDEMRAALAAHDRRALARSAHKLKGASSNIHALMLTELAYNIESQAGAVDQPRLAQMFADLEREFARATEFLTQQMPPAESKAG